MQPAFQPFWQLVWLNWIDRHLRLFWNLLILANVAGKVQLSVKHKTLSLMPRVAFAHITSTSGLS